MATTERIPLLVTPAQKALFIKKESQGVQIDGKRIHSACS
jgi:hypothetical protein